MLEAFSFRHVTGQMSEGRMNFGHALNSQLGLVMVGGFGDTFTGEYPSESTVDGISIDSSAVAEFGAEVYTNC